MIVFALSLLNVGEKNNLIASKKLSQGHPTAIFGKYLFGKRFEI